MSTFDPDKMASILKDVEDSKEALPPAKPSRKKAQKTIDSPDEARKAVARSGGCTAYAPARTKCKICGKVHPL